MQKTLLIILTVLAGAIALPAALLAVLQLLGLVLALGTGQSQAALVVLPGILLCAAPGALIWAAWWLRRQGAFVAPAILLALPVALAAAALGAMNAGQFGPFMLRFHEFPTAPPQPPPDAPARI